MSSFNWAVLLATWPLLTRNSDGWKKGERYMWGDEKENKFFLTDYVLGRERFWRSSCDSQSQLVQRDSVHTVVPTYCQSPNNTSVQGNKHVIHVWHVCVHKQQMTPKDSVQPCWATHVLLHTVLVQHMSVFWNSMSPIFHDEMQIPAVH